MKTRSQKYSL